MYLFYFPERRYVSALPWRVSKTIRQDPNIGHMEVRLEVYGLTQEVVPDPSVAHSRAGRGPTVSGR